MTDDSTQARQEAIDAALRQAERLRRAYGWLRILAEPGREPTPTAPLLTDGQRRRIAEQAALETAERAATALAPTAAPVRLALLDAQIRAGQAVRRVVGMAAKVAGERRRVRVVDPASVVEALDWLTVDGSPVWVVDRAGVVSHRGAVEDVPARVAIRIVEVLEQAAEAARAAAGITTDTMVPFPGGRCPACGARSLQIDATLRDRRYWVVRCVSDACRCTGPGCGCRQKVRYSGRAHAWSYGEFAELQRAIANQVRSPRVRRGRAGRGW